MNRFTLSSLALLMSYKVSPKEIEKIVDRLSITPSDNLYAISSEAVNVASLQVAIRKYASLGDYVADMNHYLEDAVNRRAQLVCFPQYAGLLPVSLVPQLDKCLEAVQPVENLGRPDAEEVYKVLAYFSDFVFETYFNTMASLAARHRIYIASGSTMYFEDEELCHRSFLFNDRGELVGYQDKIALSLLEQEMGVIPASEVRVFETPLGTLSILTGSDAEYFETARIAKNLGANILLSPNCFPGEYTPVISALGLNMRTQETHLYGVQSTLVGETGFCTPMEGGCAIYAPNEMVKQKNGVVAKSISSYKPEVICTPLNLDRLEMLHNPYTQDKNRDLLHKYVDRLY